MISQEEIDVDSQTTDVDAQATGTGANKGDKYNTAAFMNTDRTLMTLNNNSLPNDFDTSSLTTKVSKTMNINLKMSYHELKHLICNKQSPTNKQIPNESAQQVQLSNESKPN